MSKQPTYVERAALAVEERTGKKRSARMGKAHARAKAKQQGAAPHHPLIPPIPIGQRIQIHLDKKGKNASWLAKAIGVSRSTITRILKGEREPQAETLRGMAFAFEVDPSLFVDGTTVGKRVFKASVQAIQPIKIGRCSVGITVHDSKDHKVRDGVHYGDVILTAHAGIGGVSGSRFAIADQLRSLADHISQTEGDDMKRAFIVVLMSR